MGETRQEGWGGAESREAEGGGGKRRESRIKGKRREEEQRGEGRWENTGEEKGREVQREGAREEGVCTVILVGVNICCSACQGSIYRDGLTPGPLVEY